KSTAGIQLGDPSAQKAGEIRFQNGTAERREITRIGVAAEVGRIDQLGSGRIEHGNEGIAAAAIGALMLRIARDCADREIARARESGQILVSGLIARRPVYVVKAGAADVGRVGDGGIYYQRTSPVIGGDAYSDFIAPASPRI